MASRRAAVASLALTLAAAASACSAPTMEVETVEAENALGASARALPPICAAPEVGDCSFYAACIEPTVACGREGYALGYGTKYCERFRANDDLSDAGRAWRDAVMVCLQERLGRFLSSPLRDTATCESIIDGAFDDHPRCYTEPGASICDLPPSDWLSIVWTIDAQDLLSARGRRQIGETARICLDRWTRAWFSPFAPGAAARGDTAASEAANPETRAIAAALARDPFVSRQELMILGGASIRSEIRRDPSRE